MGHWLLAEAGRVIVVDGKNGAASRVRTPSPDNQRLVTGDPHGTDTVQYGPLSTTLGREEWSHLSLSILLPRSNKEN